MNLHKLQSALGILLLTLAVMTLNACGQTAAVIRQATYPPDFKYVSGEQLRSRMDQLAFQLQLLDQALDTGSTGQPVQQQEVLSVLSNIERIGANLQAGDAGSNHPFLQDHMSNFVTSVGRARTAATLSPPSYYPAGRVAGACVNCHRVNR